MGRRQMGQQACRASWRQATGIAEAHMATRVDDRVHRVLIADGALIAHGPRLGSLVIQADSLVSWGLSLGTRDSSGRGRYLTHPRFMKKALASPPPWIGISLSTLPPTSWAQEEKDAL